MSARPFAPIWITLPDHTPQRVDSAFEALECLTSAWPAQDDPACRRAVRICRDALDGFSSPEAARRAFLAAADALDGARLHAIPQAPFSEPASAGAAAARGATPKA